MQRDTNVSSPILVQRATADASVDLEIFFHFNINQIIDMKRKRNGAEIKSVRPEDVLFLLFPHAKTPFPNQLL